MRANKIDPYILNNLLIYVRNERTTNQATAAEKVGQERKLNKDKEKEKVDEEDNIENADALTTFIENCEAALALKSDSSEFMQKATEVIHAYKKFIENQLAESSKCQPREHLVHLRRIAGLAGFQKEKIDELFRVPTNKIGDFFATRARAEANQLERKNHLIEEAIQNRLSFLFPHQVVLPLLRQYTPQKLNNDREISSFKNFLKSLITEKIAAMAKLALTTPREEIHELLNFIKIIWNCNLVLEYIKTNKKKHKIFINMLKEQATKFEDYPNKEVLIPEIMRVIATHTNNPTYNFTNRQQACGRFGKYLTQIVSSLREQEVKMALFILPSQVQEIIALITDSRNVSQNSTADQKTSQNLSVKEYEKILVQLTTLLPLILIKLLPDELPDTLDSQEVYKKLAEFCVILNWSNRAVYAESEIYGRPFLYGKSFLTHLEKVQVDLSLSSENCNEDVGILENKILDAISTTETELLKFINLSGAQIRLNKVNDSRYGELGWRLDSVIARLSKFYVTAEERLERRRETMIAKKASPTVFEEGFQRAKSDQQINSRIAVSIFPQITANFSGNEGYEENQTPLNVDL